MMGDTRENIRQLATIINYVNSIYTEICASSAPKADLSASEFWLMYILDDGKARSQKQICDEWGFPRTTLNTVAKKCEAAGYITLVPIPKKRREMQIVLTEKGKAYAKQLLNGFYRIEKNAMEETLKKYSLEFITVLEYFGDCLKNELEKELLQRKNTDK